MNEQEYAEKYYQLAKNNDTLASSITECQGEEVLTIADETNPEIVIYVREKADIPWRRIAEINIHQQSSI